MNKYLEIKRILNSQEVVQHYLGLPEKSNSTGNWYRSPFRSEKTASFCVSKKGIHDFGDSEHYDIISFVERYFNTTSYQALKILCNDFGINLVNEYETTKTIEILKQKKREEKEAKEKVEHWFNDEMIKVSNDLKINEKCLKVFEKGSNFEVLKILYDEQIKLECYFEILFKATEQEKIKLYIKSIGG